QLDLEGQLVRERSVGPLWLNAAVRAGMQRPGTRVCRVAPWDALLVPAAATADLRWDPGDYVGVDVAPLVRLAPEFAAGFTAGYFSKARDHYAFQSLQDSVALAARLALPTPASLLDQMMIRVGPDLREMGDHERLAAPRHRLRHRRQRLPHLPTDLTADPLVHLVEHQRRDRVVLRENHFQGQHQARQLAA